MKILIISHNPVTTYNNMGKILLSFFSNFKKSELCQLYIYPSLPNFKFCKSYYRITDKDVLKSYYKFKVLGKIISDEEINQNNNNMFEFKNDKKLYRNVKNKKANRKILRDLMWFCSKWFNKDLKKWLIEQKPTHIFVTPGSAKFIYDMALKCSKFLKIPIVTCICDDYFFVIKQHRLLEYLNQQMLSNKIQKLISKTKCIITICDELGSIYAENFDKKVKVLMTASNYPILNRATYKKEVNTISYFGNIRCNRYLSLVSIGQKLDEINLQYSKNYKLFIYSNETDNQILKTFNNINSIEFKGFISGEDFDKAFFSSDILLHTEAFDPPSIDRVKHSISTKIADSLNSGICLFAYGPKQVASMHYLIKNNAAICATAENDLKEKLLETFNNTNLRKNVIKQALKCAKNNHDKNKISNQLYHIFEEIK